MDSVTRVEGFGNLSGLISLLNDEVTRTGLDDGLDVGVLVAGNDDEPTGMGPDLLVLADAQLHELVATQDGALAPEADRGVLLPRPLTALDALVDVTHRGFVGGGAPLLLALHGRILSRMGSAATARERD
jgi:hypothetical protein